MMTFKSPVSTGRFLSPATRRHRSVQSSLVLDIGLLTPGQHVEVLDLTADDDDEPQNMHPGSHPIAGSSRSTQPAMSNDHRGSSLRKSIEKGKTILVRTMYYMWIPCKTIVVVRLRKLLREVLRATRAYPLPAARK